MSIVSSQLMVLLSSTMSLVFLHLLNLSICERGVLEVSIYNKGFINLQFYQFCLTCFDTLLSDIATLKIVESS
jgi:hypothetical protein